ncbi:hypothetical protein AB0A98_39420 [Streptomyces chrestomyceticus]|uniref:hypothetical protein n=1 Tax=Streptomyces chrestomyceticus TaxID=68185 RepID=UPI0033D5BE17
MNPVREWAEGISYKGQAEHDDFDFCTVDAVAYMCRVSHTADSDTHPSRGRCGRRTWAPAAADGLHGLEAAVAQLIAVRGTVRYARRRLAPAGLTTQEWERFTVLANSLREYVAELTDEVARMTGENLRPLSD